MNEGYKKKISLSDQARMEVEKVLKDKKLNLRSIFFIAGPALIAAIAYVDPGNYATNIEAGSKYGYKLLWVIVFANFMAMLFQALSAKIGIVTGKNLAELCRDNFSKPINFVLWIVSEIAAMATDLAEFLGGAIGLSLLFKLPLLVGMFITAVATYALLILEKKGFRPLEIIISLFIGIIFVSYLLEMIIAPVDWHQVGMEIFHISIPDQTALFLAVGIIGATVMPHAIYLHSGLTQNRVRATNEKECARLIKFSNWEIVIALFLAGLINMAMVIMAASTFYGSHNDIATIEDAYHMLFPLLGGAAATLYLLSLMVSGLSSSVVSTMAGQMIMQGFVNFKIPIAVRRLVTMIPAFVVVWLGVNATQALLLSQVILSATLPIPMIALLIFSRKKELMGRFVNHKITQILAYVCTGIVLVMNFILLYLTIFEI